MQTLIKLSLSVFLFPLCALGKGHAPAYSPADTYEVDGVSLTVLIPDGMQVRMVPTQVVTVNHMSRFCYTFTTREKKVTHGLRWRVIVSDAEANFLSEDAWWDRGDWADGSVVDATTVFEYDKKPGTRLVVVLERVVNNLAVKSYDVKATGAFLRQLFAGAGGVAPTARIEARAPVSEKDELILLMRSLNTVAESGDLKRDLGALEYPAYYLSSDQFVSPDSLPNFRPITKEQIKEKLAAGQAVSYFEYRGYESVGKAVNLVINYHTPKVVGNVYLPRGMRLRVSFQRYHGQFNLTGITTEHF